MIQFLAPDISDKLTLPEGESAHCVRVLRHQAGDIINVTDGKGFRYYCRIIDAHAKHTSVAILEKYEIPKPWEFDIALAIAPTKNIDRMEWLVEKLTEIGIDKIVPLRCHHSERKEIKPERLDKIAVSAMKQSLKSLLPVITTMTPLTQFVKSCQADQKYIAYCDPTIERKLLSRIVKPGKSVAILIGPEGDFSPEEVSLAMGHGFVPVSLGDCRLRTETAALCAVQTIHVINQQS